MPSECFTGATDAADAPGATDACHHDAGLEFPQLGSFEIDRHRLASRLMGECRPACVFCRTPGLAAAPHLSPEG